MESTWLWTSYVLGVAVFNWNSSTQRPGQEDCQVHSQPGLHSEPPLLCTWLLPTEVTGDWPTYIEWSCWAHRRWRKCKTWQLFLPPMGETHTHKSLNVHGSGEQWCGTNSGSPKVSMPSRVTEMSSVEPLSKPSSIQMQILLLGKV